VPLCWNTIRFPGDGAVSCWDAWHSEVNLMTGATSETYCHIKCPEEDLDLGDLASPAASAKTTKNKGNVTNLAGATRKRKRVTMPSLVLPARRRSGRNNGKAAAE
jgi:hypothetical protein